MQPEKKNKATIIFLFSLSSIFIALHFFTLVYLWSPVLTNHSGILDRNGDPVGLDFPLFYAASSLALSGRPVQVYDFNTLKGTESSLTGRDWPLLWPYPPSFLLIILPLGLFPYLTSLLFWLSTTLLFYIYVVRKIAPHSLTVWLTLAFPGSYFNVLNSHNGFLSASLLGGGLLCLDSKPWLGGALLGLLSYKPHLAILIPPALIAGRRWQALLAATVSAAGLALLSALLFGFEIWSAFWNTIPLAFNQLESGRTVWLQRMPTIFAAIKLAGFGGTTALVVQGMATLIIMGFIVKVWYKDASPTVRNALLALGVILATPHAFPYEYTFLALAIAWLAYSGYLHGWLPGEKLLLLVVWLMPLLASILRKKGIMIPFPTITLVTFYIFILRRWDTSC